MKHSTVLQPRRSQATRLTGAMALFGKAQRINIDDTVTVERARIIALADGAWDAPLAHALCVTPDFMIGRQ